MKNGVVTAIAKGNVTITTTYEKKKYQCKVRVVKPTSVDKLLYYEDSGYIVICDVLDESLKQMYIPSEIDGYPVCMMRDFAFRGRMIEEIVLPETLTYIGEYSYPYRITSNSGSVQNSFCIDTSYGVANCRSLITYPKDKKDKEYYVPEGVERIEEKAFQGNQYLKKIVLPNTVREIGIGAFADLKNDVEIVIPASTTEFGIYDDYTIVGQDWSFGSNGNGFKNVTIVTPKGSAAEKYAKKYEIKYRNE